MTKKFLFLIFSISVVLGACGTAQTQSVHPVQTFTPTLSPAPTQTSIPPTITITPLPTISTFTPTFDVSTIVTVTPAPKAECPKEDPLVVAKFATPDSYGSYEIYSTSEILDYLNSGGTLDRLQDSGLEEIADITGDGLHEVVYKNFRYSFFGCKDGKYQEFLDFMGDFGANLADILDLNKDGTPELIFYKFNHYGYVEIYIFEWDGSKFRSLIDVGIDVYAGEVIDYVSMTDEHKLLDMNKDGVKEIVIEYDNNKLCGGFGGFCDGTPTRIQTTTLSWNGKNYIDLKQNNYSPPQYRFQALQDGDWQTSYGNYAEAVSSYQAVIFDDNLEWWSPEREVYERYRYMAQYDPTPVVSPTPIPDPAEYPRLAAYAYYRIMLLHLAQGQDAEAASTYETLQETFSGEPYAAPYGEMATAFWESYQSTERMYDGCAAAIQYAVEHSDILTPLGSDYHGAQSKMYKPEDVCPFR